MAVAHGDDEKRPPAPQATVTIWLMPNEPAAKASEDPRLLAQEVNQFTALYEDLGLTVLNTTVESLHDQLLAWNPEFAVPTWPMVKGQAKTLDAIAVWAGRNNTNVQVLVVDWSRALVNLRRALETSGHSYPPDLAQVGDTWVRALDKQGLIEPADGPRQGGLKWRPRPNDGTAVSLPYIQDIRLLYHWIRLPTAGPGEPALILDDTEAWSQILDRLDVWAGGDGPQSRRPPMVMPIGYSPNLLHDLLPLVRAGGGEFLLRSWWLNLPKMDLTSSKALSIPTLLAARAVRNPETERAYRVVAFPEMNHQEAIGRFEDGHYSATIEPLSLLRNWRDDFVARQRDGRIPPDTSFWNHAGVAVPPATFKGGSDLIVTRRADRTKLEGDLTFDLARYLASAPACRRLLAEYGHLPVHEADSGIASYLEALSIPPEHRERIALAIRRATNAGKGYPPIAPVNELEASDTLQMIHGLFVAMAEWTPGAGVRSNIEDAAKQAQLKANTKINWWTRFWEVSVKQQLVAVLSVLFAMLVLTALGCVSLLQRNRASRQEAAALESRNRAIRQEAATLESRNRLLDLYRRVRGFTSSAILVFQEVHASYAPSPSCDDGLYVDELPKDGEKRRIILAGINGWRRGRKDSNWDRGPIRPTVWNAVMLTLDSSGRLLQEYHHQSDTGGGPSEPDTFLCAKKETRGATDPADDHPRFDVDVPSDVEVDLPFMLENALICLLQNALKASKDEDTGRYSRIDVRFDRATRELVISNQASHFSPKLLDAVNGSQDFEEFAAQVEKLNKGDTAHRAGIGLVLAYEIFDACYGKQPRIKVEPQESKVSLSVLIP